MYELNKLQIKQLPEEPGVYIIYAKSSDGRTISISRFCGVDRRGILYIGRTSKQNLKERVYQFYASSNLKMKTNNHSGGNKYFSNVIIRKTLGEHSLHFNFEITEVAEVRENELLSKYMTEFGEYPPLNK